MKTIGEMCAEVGVICLMLSKVEIGGFIAYGEVSEKVGQPIEGHRWWLDSARRIAQREHGYVFGCVRGKGLKRLDDVGIIGEGKLHRDCARRKAHRGLVKLSKVKDYISLTSSDKAAYNATATILAVQKKVAMAPTRRRVLAAVEKTDNRLPIGKVGSIFQE